MNYTLRSAGQIHNWQFNPPNANSIAAFCGVDLSLYNAPIIFFKPMRSEQRIGCMTGDERDWHASALGSTKKMFKIMKWGNKDIGSVQYYIFDRWIPPERSSYGIQISDAAGGLIFDSGWMFMKIRNVIWMDPGYPNHTGDDPEVGTNWTVVGSAGAGIWRWQCQTPGVDTTELEWRRLDDVRVLSLFGRRQQDNSFIGSSRGVL